MISEKSDHGYIGHVGGLREESVVPQEALCAAALESVSVTQAA